MTNTLQIYSLGGISFRFGSEDLTGLIPRKAQALLIYLACTGRPQSREALGELLWNARDHERLLGNLRLILNRIPQPLAATLTRTRQSLSLAPSQYWFDAGDLVTNLSGVALSGKNPDDFQHLAIKLEQGLALYKGDFLAGFYVTDAPAFEEWMLAEQARFRRGVVEALRYLTEGYLGTGAYQAGEVHARRWLQIDPFSEEAHRHLMRILVQTGQRGAALAQYQVCQRLLADELGVEPETATTAVYEDIRSGNLVVSTDTHKPAHNLPPQATAFVGRSMELTQIASQFAMPDCRLLTLVGLPGIGKTRLALEAAADQIGGFRDGVYFVSLAGVASSAFLVSAIAEALDFAFSTTEDPKVQLFNYLRGKGMLLVLDNFEHLLDGAGLLLEILAHAPKVKFLVTSRERLNLQAEWLIQVTGLIYPTNETTFEPENYSAVQLFLQTARRVRADFSLHKEYTEVCRICRLVGGMPLGIEMAAAWIRMLSCKQIASQIERDLDLLITTQHDVPMRHRNMRVVFEHSWNLLSAQERAVLMKLAVFRGGFAAEAAIQVTGTSLPLLASLVDKSLLQPQHAGRYQLHELLRQYAEEKLSASEEADAVHAQHFDFFSALTRDGELKLHGPEALIWIARFEADYDNLRVALSWGETHMDWLQATLQMAGDLFWFWSMSNHIKEGYDWLVRLLRCPGAEAHTRARGWALHGAAALAFFRTDYRAIGPHIEESRQIAEELGDQLLLMQAFYGMVAALITHNRFQEALPVAEKVVMMSQEMPHKFHQSIAYNSLGQVYVALHEPTMARAAWEKSLELSEEADDLWMKAAAYHYFGLILEQQQDFGAARVYQEKAMIAYQRLGERSIQVRVIVALAEICGLQADYEHATDYYQEALAISRDQGFEFHSATCLYELGRIAHRRGRLVEAKSCFEQSMAIYQQIQNQQGIDACLVALERKKP